MDQTDEKYYSMAASFSFRVPRIPLTLIDPGDFANFQKIDLKI